MRSPVAVLPAAVVVLAAEFYKWRQQEHVRAPCCEGAVSAVVTRTNIKFTSWRDLAARLTRGHRLTLVKEEYNVYQTRTLSYSPEGIP